MSVPQAAAAAAAAAATAATVDYQARAAVTAAAVTRRLHGGEAYASSGGSSSSTPPHPTTAMPTAAPAAQTAIATAAAAAMPPPPPPPYPGSLMSQTTAAYPVVALRRGLAVDAFAAATAASTPSSGDFGGDGAAGAHAAAAAAATAAAAGGLRQRIMSLESGSQGAFRRSDGPPAGGWAAGGSVAALHRGASAPPLGRPLGPGTNQSSHHHPYNRPHQQPQQLQPAARAQQEPSIIDMDALNVPMGPGHMQMVYAGGIDGGGNGRCGNDGHGLTDHFGVFCEGGAAAGNGGAGSGGGGTAAAAGYGGGIVGAPAPAAKRLKIPSVCPLVEWQRARPAQQKLQQSLPKLPPQPMQPPQGSLQAGYEPFHLKGFVPNPFVPGRDGGAWGNGNTSNVTMTPHYGRPGVVVPTDVFGGVPQAGIFGSGAIVGSQGPYGNQFASPQLRPPPFYLQGGGERAMGPKVPPVSGMGDMGGMAGMGGFRLPLDIRTAAVQCSGVAGFPQAGGGSDNPHTSAHADASHLLGGCGGFPATIAPAFVPASEIAAAARRKRRQLMAAKRVEAAIAASAKRAAKRAANHAAKPAAKRAAKHGAKPAVNAAGAASAAAAGAASAAAAGAVSNADDDTEPNPNQRVKTSGSSLYKGVVWHCRNHRWEAHIWDSSVRYSKTSKRRRKRGKQVYLGMYGTELEAARAYDMAAIVFLGPRAKTNFPLVEYRHDIEKLTSLGRDGVVRMLRNGSSGFSRGTSKYRGVSRHHKPGCWEACIGKVGGSGYLYLGTFEVEAAAAMAYDYAAIHRRGERAITNFDPCTYRDVDTGRMRPLQQLPPAVQAGLAPSCLTKLNADDDQAGSGGDGDDDDDDDDDEEEQDEQEVEEDLEGQSGGGAGGEDGQQGPGRVSGRRRPRLPLPPPELWSLEVSQPSEKELQLLLKRLLKATLMGDGNPSSSGGGSPGGSGGGNGSPGGSGGGSPGGSGGGSPGGSGGGSPGGSGGGSPGGSGGGSPGGSDSGGEHPICGGGGDRPIGSGGAHPSAHPSGGSPGGSDGGTPGGSGGGSPGGSGGGSPGGSPGGSGGGQDMTEAEWQQRGVAVATGGGFSGGLSRGAAAAAAANDGGGMTRLARMSSKGATSEYGEVQQLEPHGSAATMIAPAGAQLVHTAAASPSSMLLYHAHLWW
ncbi:hypothetical protein PLESTM_000330000 [Pleodorina starrii]|nr:hypothetical protein PLESTM_000330000 [Pleodorina starrii]